MGLLDRLHRIDDAEEEPEPSPETAERVQAILGVITSYLDPANTLGATLLVIARRELAQASAEQLDIVIVGIMQAADRLRPYLPKALPSAASERA